jgi:16S rRNA (cytosine1402-N4)-methyltransferase
MPKQKQIHIPVLLNETLQYLSPEVGQSYLDVTAGYGGHATAVLERTQNYRNAVLVDRDDRAITALKEAFTKTDAKIVCNNFLSASDDLKRQGIKFDMILADLGVSSLHLNEPERGFSFNSGPLDMRLAKIVALAWPGKSRNHPATRTFQALRIAVNDELNQLAQALPIWLELLAPGGRLVIISFHSLEDRIVKQFFAEHAGNGYDSEMTLLTKKPVQATNDEIVSNPRARSAKLRAGRKIKTNL